MKIKDFPKQNRPRERFKQPGPTALSDAELFAIILRIRSRSKKGDKGANKNKLPNKPHIPSSKTIK